MKNLISGLISILSGLIIGGIILKLSGISPLDALYVILKGSFSKPNYVGYIVVKSTPLILTGLSIAFAFRTGLFNIGAEGQFIIGALSAAVFGILFNFPAYIQIPLVMILATLMAGIYGGICGYLKAKYGVHEVLSTIMFNWIALYFSNHMVFVERFRRPHMEATESINPTTRISFLDDWKISDAGLDYLAQHDFLRLLVRPPLNMGIVIAIIVAIICYYVLFKTSFGRKLQITGHSPKAAEYAGINTKFNMTASMFIAGAIAGLAGATHVMGVSKNVSVLSAFEGYGFDGIATALIGASHPIGVIFSGFFLGMLKYAGQKIQPQLEAPGELVGIVIGIIVFFMAVPNFISLIKNKFKKESH